MTVLAYDRALDAWRDDPLLCYHPDDPELLQYGSEDWNGPHAGPHGGIYWINNGGSHRRVYSTENPGGKGDAHKNRLAQKRQKRDQSRGERRQKRSEEKEWEGQFRQKRLEEEGQRKTAAREQEVQRVARHAEAAHALVGAMMDRVKRGEEVSPEEADGFSRQLFDHLKELTVKDIQGLKQKYGLKASGVKAELALKVAAAALRPGKPIPVQKEQDHGPERGSGISGDAGSPPEASGPVADPTGGSVSPTADQGGAANPQPTGPAAARRVPASQSEVGKRIDRYEKLFRSRGSAQAADWMKLLRDHVDKVGTDAALAGLGEERASARGEEPRQYEGGWDDMGAFSEAYLNRHGIVPTFQIEGERSDSLRTLSSLPDEEIARRQKGGDFAPIPPSIGTKLDEAKHLPGLELSEDVSAVMGKPVTHLTPDVMAKMDERYGKGGWIIKSYGSEAFAGFGIFFPQRAAAIQQDACNTLWSAGENIGRYGFQLRRDETNRVVGLQHQNGDRYDFGTDQYKNTIGGDARHWADKAAEAAAHEQGAELPLGGRQFMAQPAFPVVGVSDADRAAGKTHEGTGEGRVHIVTRNGKAEIVPHGTWIKGEWLPVVFESEDTRAMAKAAVDAINALPEKERGGQIYAPDVVRTANGFKVVEANPADATGASGYLGNNPFIIDSYVSHLTGREPAHVQFIRKLLTSKKDKGSIQ